MNRRPSESSAFLAPFATLERDLAGRGPAWLRRARRDGLDRFAALGFPTTRDEEWKTTSVAPITRTRFRPAVPAPDLPARLPALADAVPGALRLVFLNGRLVSGPAAPAPDGLWIGGLAQALRDVPEALERHLAPVEGAECSAFCALNAAFSEDAGVVLVRDGLELRQPLHLVHLAAPGPEPSASHPRTLLVVGRSSAVQVVESYLPAADGVCLTNAVTDVILGENSSVRHYRLQEESEQAFHVSTLRCRQGRDSRYEGLNLDLGGRLARHDLSAVLEGVGGECSLDGLYVTRGEQHVDNHTTIDHASPGCRSREVYKGVLAGSSRTTFRGRIIVRPGAKQTDARQSNPNLILSERALAHTRPQLEIYADDVKCTHGATVGRLDDDAVFYLRSRAIAEEDARELLISAFADEVLERVGIDPLRHALKDAVARHLPAGKGLTS